MFLRRTLAEADGIISTWLEGSQTLSGLRFKLLIACCGDLAVVKRTRSRQRRRATMDKPAWTLLHWHSLAMTCSGTSRKLRQTTWPSRSVFLVSGLPTAHSALRVRGASWRSSLAACSMGRRLRTKPLAPPRRDSAPSMDRRANLRACEPTGDEAAGRGDAQAVHGSSPLLEVQRHLKEDKALARELTVGEAAQDALTRERRQAVDTQVRAEQLPAAWRAALMIVHISCASALVEAAFAARWCCRLGRDSLGAAPGPEFITLFFRDSTSWERHS